MSARIASARVPLLLEAVLVALEFEYTDTLSHKLDALSHVLVVLIVLELTERRMPLAASGKYNFFAFFLPFFVCTGIGRARGTMSTSYFFIVSCERRQVA